MTAGRSNEWHITVPAVAQAQQLCFEPIHSTLGLIQYKTPKSTVHDMHSNIIMHRMHSSVHLIDWPISLGRSHRNGYRGVPIVNPKAFS